MKESIKKTITKFSTAGFQEVEDEIAVETILTIWLNETFISSIISSPHLKKELALGYLYTTGLITTYKDIKEVEIVGYDIKINLYPHINLEARLSQSHFINRIITSSCNPPEYWLQIKKGKGLPLIDSDIQISIPTIFDIIHDLNSNSALFRRTGAVHAAGLYENTKTRVFIAEDVGRHNAIDKVIGYALSEDIPLEDKVLVSTGRLTADIIFKSAICKIPIVASMAAATDSGIAMAKATNTTLIGFVRGSKRLNIYASPSRIAQIKE
ncbi:MAG: formate dehydrogenase accessory sulfurtransferase FdhD [Candidatus Helarchaeota archaeon]